MKIRDYTPADDALKVAAAAIREAFDRGYQLGCRETLDKVGQSLDRTTGAKHEQANGQGTGQVGDVRHKG